MNITFDLIIQGPIFPYIDNLISEYKKLSFVNKIIISTWDSYSEYKLLLFDNDIKFVINKDIENPGRNNRNRKIKSSLGGINASESDYVIVLRSDQLWDVASFEEIYNFFLMYRDPDLTFVDNHKLPINKIICNHLVQDYPFHPNDWFFMGHKIDMRNFFDIPYDLNPENNLRAEIYFASHYFSRFNSNAKMMLENYENYLLDNSYYFQESISLSKKISSKVLKPLPKKLVKVRWFKYSNDFHDWELIEKNHDLLFHDNDPHYK